MTQSLRDRTDRHMLDFQLTLRRTPNKRPKKPPFGRQKTGLHMAWLRNR